MIEPSSKTDASASASPLGVLCDPRSRRWTQDWPTGSRPTSRDHHHQPGLRECIGDDQREPDTKTENKLNRDARSGSADRHQRRSINNAPKAIR